ncbi:MAG: 2OG-Fe(II) oxygenase [Pseudomonadales bacterium]|nr:2OG-Fe(II) oxygenase [Pseudomonadales bacterium]
MNTVNATFSQDWLEWIDLNAKRGCDLNEMQQILINNGFAQNLVAQELEQYRNHSPVEVCRDEALDYYHSVVKDSEQFQQTLESRLLFPNAQKVETNNAELYIVENFLNSEECSAIISRIQTRLRRSTIVEASEPDQYFRTSKTCDLGDLDDPFVKEIDERICRYIGIDGSYSEPIQGQYYDVGEEFKAHTDYFEAGDPSFKEITQNAGQRSWTFMIYLNDTEMGGETNFVKLDMAYKPKQGMAVIWSNIDQTGKPNINTMHHAQPVLKGYKAIITKWFRTKGNGNPALKTDNEMLENYTQIGFKKINAPVNLQKALTVFYKNKLDQATEESLPDFIEGTSATSPSDLMQLTSAEQEYIHKELRPICEEWSGVKLQPTYVFGIRKYNDSAQLKCHRDRIETHIISAIINIDQDVSEDWPLLIEDNYYRKHNVILKPGEMVL